MEVLLADLYGPRRVGARRAGCRPRRWSSTPRYRLAAVGAPPPPRWLTTYAVDVVAPRRRVVARRPGPRRHADRHRLRAARPGRDGPGRRRAARARRAPATWRRSAASRPSCATRWRRRRRSSSPRIVLFSGGVDEPAYVEHSSLARLLGFHLVEAPDLVVREGRLWLRTLGGLDPIDVVYRRLADAGVDPIEVSATGTTGVPGLAAGGGRGRRRAGQRPRLGRARGPRRWRRTGRPRSRASPASTLDARQPREPASELRRRAGVPRRPGRSTPTSSSGCTPSPAPTASR